MFFKTLYSDLFFLGGKLRLFLLEINIIGDFLSLYHSFDYKLSVGFQNLCIGLFPKNYPRLNKYVNSTFSVFLFHHKSIDIKQKKISKVTEKYNQECFSFAKKRQRKDDFYYFSLFLQNTQTYVLRNSIQIISFIQRNSDVYLSQNSKFKYLNIFVHPNFNTHI